MIHWVMEYDAHGYHKAQCGVKVPTKEVELQRFEGVFRFLSKAENAIRSNKVIIPNNFCENCWNMALDHAKVIAVGSSKNQHEKRSNKK